MRKEEEDHIKSKKVKKRKTIAPGNINTVRKTDEISWRQQDMIILYEGIDNFTNFMNAMASFFVEYFGCT